MRYTVNQVINNVYHFKGETMAANALVTTRINETVKQEATEVLATMGLSVSDAVRLLLTRVANEKALPFELWQPNAETIAALEEAKTKKLVSFGSVSALMDDLNADD